MSDLDALVMLQQHQREETKRYEAGESLDFFWVSQSVLDNSCEELDFWLIFVVCITPR